MTQSRYSTDSQWLPARACFAWMLCCILAAVLAAGCTPPAEPSRVGSSPGDSSPGTISGPADSSPGTAEEAPAPHAGAVNIVVPQPVEVRDDAEIAAEVERYLAEHAGTLDQSRLVGDPSVPTELLLAGRSHFLAHCARCHGAQGDGQGPEGQSLSPPPRDFRPGVFKFTTTAYGQRPRLSDLERTIARGVAGTSMAPFAELGDSTVRELAQYVEFLARRGELAKLLAAEAESEDTIDPEVAGELAAQVAQMWQEAEETPVLEVPTGPAMTPESIARGKEDFLSEALGCYRCHAIDCRGQPPDTTLDLKDAWGDTIRVHDMTLGVYKSGPASEDLYRRIVLGVSGTAMGMLPADVANDSARVWSLVHYIKSQERTTPPPKTGR